MIKLIVELKDSNFKCSECGLNSNVYFVRCLFFRQGINRILANYYHLECFLKKEIAKYNDEKFFIRIRAE